MVDYQGKKVVIVGLGLTGLSCIKFFITRGLIPRVMDTRISPPGLNKLPTYIKCHLGSLNDKWLLTADLIIISPGISLSNNSLKNAAKSGTEIIGDIELFCREVKAPIVAITGSNGKSTVTTLLGQMAKEANINVGIGGNIGLPALTLLDQLFDLYILEISSFQLETTNSLQANAATILNITNDHMDRYPLGIQQYRAAKLRIYNNAKICVFNIDDPLTIALQDNTNNKRYVSFGTKIIGDYYLNNYHDKKWLYMKGKKILNVKEMKIFGQHNYSNALAAIALADVINLPLASIIKILTTFSGLPHCLQLVLEQHGIRWINDSKSTNVSSTKAALNNLHIINGNLHLLLGGDDKSADFSSLKPYLVNNKTYLYCFGQSASKLATLNPKITKQTTTLEQAMYLLVSRVKPGDTVLLSPACASLDQFKNFQHRGNVFTYLAKKISNNLSFSN